MGLESQFKKEITDSLRKMVPGPIYVQKMHGNQFQTGVPDLICCILGVPVMIELKVVRNLPKRLSSVAVRADWVTPLQKDNLMKWSQAGGLGLVLFGVMRKGRRKGEERVLCPIFRYGLDGSSDLTDVTLGEMGTWERVFYYEGKGFWSMDHVLRLIQKAKGL